MDYEEKARHDYEEDEQQRLIMDGINYAIKNGELDERTAQKMTFEDCEYWINEHYR